MYWNSFCNCLQESLKLAKVGNTPTSGSIPASNSRESRLEAADVVVALGNVTETLVAGLVEPGVEETETRLAVGDEVVVEESNDGSGGRSRSTGADEADTAAAVVDGVDSVESSDIGVGTARLVVRTVKLAVELGNVSVDSVGLVVGGREVVGETAAAVGISLLIGTKLVGSANDGDVGASGRERGSKRVTRAATGTRVTSSAENADTTSTKLHELVADGVGVVGGNGGFVIAVGDGQSGRRGVKTQEVVEPVKVRLVGVVAAAVPRRSATSGLEDALDGVDKRDDNLGIQIGLALAAGVGVAVVDADNGQVNVGGQVGVVLADVGVQVGDTGDLLEEAGNTNGGRAGGVVALDVVVVAEALGDNTVAARGRGRSRALSVLGSGGGVDRVHLLLAKTEIGEHGGGLDHGDGIADTLGKAVAGGADSLAASSGLLVDAVVGVEELLGLVDADGDLEEAVVDIARVDAVRGQPLGDGIDMLLGGCSKSVNLSLGHVLAVAGVVGVAHLHEALVQSVHVLLLEADVKIHGVISGSSGLESPSLGNGSKRLLGHELDGRGGCQSGHQHR